MTVETNYKTFNELLEAEKRTYSALPIRVKKEIDEYFNLCREYRKRKFTDSEVKRFVILTLLADKYNLSPLCY